MGLLEVEVEFKEDEHVVLSLLEVELEFRRKQRKNR